VASRSEKVGIKLERGYSTQLRMFRLAEDRLRMGSPSRVIIPDRPGAGVALRAVGEFAVESRADRPAIDQAQLGAERCHVAGDWLMVDGKRATYRIHLGSGASQLAASGRHLCIVPKGAEDGLEFPPFEGDATTTLILSKAMLLAQDDRIEDPTILSQLAA
jgi:hypothetical protein